MLAKETADYYASMRPRRVRRGELGKRTEKEGLADRASMRPRRVRRGEPGRPVGRRWRGSWLQCGHGEFAVENLSAFRVQKRLARRRFNAATASSPWRTRGHASLTRRGHAASMRPRRV